MQSVQKLIDYFLVVGLDQKLTPCKYPDEEEEKHITNLELFFGYITEEMKASQTENEKWIDLDGYQTVWLKVTYNKSSIPVISIDFLSIPTEKDSLKWNGSPNTQLVHIANLKRNDPPNRDKYAIKDENKLIRVSDVLIQRDFDLTEILGFERVPGHAIVLSYELQDKDNYKPPLEDVVCIVGERKRGPNGITHELSNLEEGYESIKRKFVNKDKTFRCIAFKKGKDFLSKSFIPAVIDRYPQEIVHDTQEILSHIQMFCFPDGIKFSRQIREPTSFSFILTKESGARVFGTTLVFDEDFPEELLDQLEYGPVTKEHPLFTQKAICLLSHYSFPAEFKEMLKKIYSIHISKNDIPLERYICNLIDETPLPIKGKVGILVDLGKPLHFKRAANYPIIASRAIHNLFTVFDAQKVIELVKMVLLEKKILLISKYKSLLTDISEALTGLIFPFVWVRPLIPILPVAWRDCLECLMPFLMGLNTSTISEDEVPIAEDVVRVYLDKGEIVCPEKIPQLPEKWYKSLFKRLEVFDAWHEIYGNTETNFDAAFDIHSPIHESEDQGLDVFEIQDAFFGLITSILKHYNKFFTPPKENKDGRADLKETFDITEFLKRKKAHKEGSFLYVLVKETSFFSNFIQARASFYKQGVEYQFIDNCIKKKRSKKEPTFIHYPDIEITFNTYAPNNADIPPGKKYSYKNFPKLNPELFIAPRIISNLTAEQESPLQVTNIEPQKLASLEDSKWAKLLLESIYTAWFSVFNVMLKEDFKNYFNRMAEYAILLFEDAKNRNIKPNEVMYKSLIEALCYCDMNEKALQIVNKLRDEKTELSPFAFGIYLDTMTQARKFRSKLKKGPDSEQGLELGQESFSQSDKNNSGILRCVNFQTHNKCPNCSEVLVSEDIASGWKKSYNEYTTTCRYCSKSFLATLKVIEQCEGVSTESAIHFLSPLVVRKELENLFKKKGTSVLLSDAFKKDHATIYWNMYLYFNLIKAPSSLLETDLSQAQVLKNLDALEELLQNSQEEKKKNWNFSFFSNMTKSKTVISREEISQIGSIDKQANAKTSESTKISNDSIRMNIINDPPELNSQLRKTFFNLFSDMHKELDRRQEEYEVELKFKKGVCPADSHFLEETQEYCKSPGEDVSAQES